MIRANSAAEQNRYKHHYNSVRELNVKILLVPENDLPSSLTCREVAYKLQMSVHCMLIGLFVSSAAAAASLLRLERAQFRTCEFFNVTVDVHCSKYARTEFLARVNVHSCFSR